MFKASDAVRCTEHYHPNLEVGKHYIVVDIRSDSFIRLRGYPLTHWNPARFELVREVNDTMNVSESARSANPAIEEYTKTVTVRKIRANTFPISFADTLKVVPHGERVTLRFNNNRGGFGATLRANELRTLAKQLIEIADVLDERANS